MKTAGAGVLPRRAKEAANSVTYKLEWDDEREERWVWCGGVGWGRRGRRRGRTAEGERIRAGKSERKRGKETFLLRYGGTKEKKAGDVDLLRKD